MNFYATGDFDRRSQQREDEAWIESLLANPDTLLVPVWKSQNLLVAGDGGDPVPAFLPAGLHGDLIVKAGALALLGLDGGRAHFLLDVSALDDAELAGLGRFTDLRTVGPLLPQRQGAVLAYARGLAHWHQRHLFCGVCGSPTAPKSAGHQRRCTNPACGVVQFPRTDPAVIMRVVYRGPGGERLLMARQAVWPKGMHSILAGFVEPGESLEDAVAREVFEEVGLRVGNIRYFASQPWPFPSSLMLGFSSETDDDRILLAEDELEAARWVTRDDLRNSPENEEFRLPRRDSISRLLIEDWLAG